MINYYNLAWFNQEPLLLIQYNPELNKVINLGNLLLRINLKDKWFLKLNESNSNVLDLNPELELKELLKSLRSLQEMWRTQADFHKCENNELNIYGEYKKPRGNTLYCLGHLCTIDKPTNVSDRVLFTAKDNSRIFNSTVDMSLLTSRIQSLK